MTAPFFHVFVRHPANQQASQPASSQPASQRSHRDRQHLLALPASAANQPGSQPAATQPAIEPAAGQFANQSGSTPAANQRSSPKQANYGNPSTQRQQCTPMGPNFPRELMETTHCIFYQHTALSITLEKKGVSPTPQQRCAEPQLRYISNALYLRHARRRTRALGFLFGQVRRLNFRFFKFFFGQFRFLFTPSTFLSFALDSSFHVSPLLTTCF